MGKGLNLATEKEVFITTGFDNWKKAHQRFNPHIESGLHKKSLLKVELLKQDSVSTLLNKQAMAEQEQNQAQLLKQLSSFRFLLRQYRSDDSQGLSSWITKQKYISTAILDEQIEQMGSSLLKKLLSDIRSAEFFYNL